jgi:hypothetical protein
LKSRKRLRRLLVTRKNLLPEFGEARAHVRATSLPAGCTAARAFVPRRRVRSWHMRIFAALHKIPSLSKDSGAPACGRLWSATNDPHGESGFLRSNGIDIPRPTLPCFSAEARNGSAVGSLDRSHSRNACSVVKAALKQ